MSQLIFDLPHRVALNSDDFLVADCNQLAVNWLDQWPTWPHHAAVVFGPASCGKTHLAHVWQNQTQALIIPYDQLAQKTNEIERKIGQSVVVEDIDSQHGDEEALFHLFNWLKEESGSLLMTARLAPSHWNIALPDLRSRLNAVPNVEIGAPDDMVLTALLVKLCADRQIQLSQAVLDYVVPRMERSFDAVASVVEAVDKASLAQSRRITVPLVRDVLKHQLS